MRPHPLVMVALFLGFMGRANPANCAPPANYDDATLRAVRFVDKHEGWAVGDQGVIWHTIDGGKTWERQASGTRASLRAVQFLTPYVGFVVGRTELPHGAGSHGVVLSTADGGATWREVTSSLLPGLCDVEFTDENRGKVASKTERFATDKHLMGNERLGPIESVATKYDWFETTDGGRSWRRTVSPDEGKFQAPAPRVLSNYHSTHILDKNSGWSVGAFGTIRKASDEGWTTDGRTWATMKCSGQRAAVLFVHARFESVPLGTIAQLAKEGYLCVVLAGHSTDEPRIAAAIRAVGGAVGDTLGYKSRTEDFQLACLVRAIRTWQPEVVVTDLLTPDAPPEDRQVLLRVKEAFEQAGSTKAFPVGISKEDGLKPHAAKKLYALAPATGEANVALDFTKFVPEFGGATKDFVEPAAALLSAPNPDGVRFRLLSHRLPGAEKHTSLMEGIHLAEGGTARRHAMTPVPDVAQAEKATQLRRRLEDVMLNPVSVGGLMPALSQTIGGLSGLPDELAARTAVALGRRYAEMGQWTTARELFAVVAEKYAAQPDAIEAIRWLIRYQASGEVRRCIELGHQPVYQRGAFLAVEADAVQQASHVEGFAPKQLFRFTGPDALKQWHQACLDLEPKMAAFGAAYTRDPANNLSTLAARRQLGLNLHAAKQLQALGTASHPVLDDELRLLTNTEAKRPMAQCKATSVRPLLDGKLDDECWKAATPIAMKTVDGYPTEARFASDDKFLYVAVTCGHPDGKQVPKVEKRGRDADLTGHDRIELFLDMDRDYQTYYRLRVDHRGAVAEDCWGDAAWNPRWFVAHDSTATGWTMEVAIPWAELTSTAPTQIWAMNVVRVVPGVGVASWGGPSDETPTPMAMGLLKFAK